MKKGILLVTLAIGYNLSVAQTCIEAQYPLDGNASDVSGNSYHGTPVNGPVPSTDRFGNTNAAYSFDGSNDYVLLPDDFDYPQRTVMFWFYANVIGSTISGVYEQDHAGIQYSQTELGVREVGGVDKFSFCVGWPANNHVLVNVTEGAWHHVAVVVGASDIKYYLDCNLVGTVFDMTNGHSNSGVAQATIGALNTLGYNLNGKVDDLRIYDCALTAAEVLGLCGETPVEEAGAQLQEVNIFPNPATDLISFEGNTEMIGRIEIYDVAGRKVYESVYTGPVPISFLSQGLYYVRIFNKDGNPVAHRELIKSN
jgi:hypothetical protein